MLPARNALPLEAGADPAWLVAAGDAARLEREGYERLDPAPALACLQRGIRDREGAARDFLLRAGVVDGAWLRRTRDRELLVWLGRQLEARRLVVLGGRGDARPRGLTDESARVWARLERALDGKPLTHAGDLYKVVPGWQLARVRRQAHATVLRQEEARAALSTLARSPAVPAPARDLLLEAREHVAPPPAPFEEPRGLVVLRIAQERTFRSSDEVALTPSALRAAAEKGLNHLEILVFGPNGKPLKAKYSLTLPDGERMEGSLDGSGRVRAETRATGTCKFLVQPGAG